MQRKQHTLVSLVKVVTCAVLALGAAAQVRAADASGTWTWSTPGREGAEPRKSTLTLKVEGEKVTGKLSAPGRQGAVTDLEVKEGKIKGDEISFITSVERGGNTITTKYMGKISGDTIKGTVERPGRGGGDPTKNPWEAKRETDKK